MNKKVFGCLGLGVICLASVLTSINKTEKVSALDNEPYLSWDFEDGQMFDNCGSGMAKLIDKADNPDGVYEGQKAMEVSGIWARKQYSSGAQYSDMLVNGDFYEIDMFAKRATTGTFSVICQLSFWGNKPELGWKASNTRIYATPYISLSDDEWHELKYKFAVYGDGFKTYLYHKGGVLQEVSELAGYYVTDSVLIDVGATNGKKAYFDNISFTKTTESKDAFITLYGDGNQDATIKVFDGENELSPQPQITKYENTYCIKNLEYGSLSQTYEIKVYKNNVEVGSQLVSYLKSETNCCMDKYSVNLNLYDELYNPVVNSVVKIDKINDIDVYTKNNNGTVAIEGLSRNLTAIVEAPGYIVKTVDINYLNTEYDVLLKEAKEVVEYDSNLNPDGSMENGFVFQSSSNIEYELTTKEQVTGNYSLAVKSNQNNSYFKYRMNKLNVPDKTTFAVVYQVKTASGTASIYNGVEYVGNGKNVASGGSVYPTKLCLTDPIVINDKWQTIKYTVSMYFDDLSGIIYTSINGSEYVPHDEASLAVAAADFTFGIVESDVTVYIDNYSAFEVYDANIKVKDEDGKDINNADFEIISPLCDKKTINPEYDSETGAYLFKGMYGETKIYAKYGDKAYPVANIDKSSHDITISEPYTITVTLKTPKGRLISGAKVSARVGIVTKGVFEEVSEGVYVLENVMEVYSVVVVKSGYTFMTKTNVNSKNCTFEMIGEPDEPEEDIEEPANNKGCDGSIIASSMIICVMSMLGTVLALKKKD